MIAGVHVNLLTLIKMQHMCFISCLTPAVCIFVGGCGVEGSLSLLLGCVNLCYGG